MPRANVIRWRDGAGWLVLSGGGDSASGEIEAEALARVAAGDPVAYIWAASDIETADDELQALKELGAPSGYLVDILAEDDDSLRAQIGNAGLIVLGDGPNADTLRSGLLGAAVEAIEAAYDRGGIVLGIGQGAAVLGGLLEEKTALNLVEDAIIMPDYDQNEKAAHMRDLLARHPDSYGLGIGAQSALALGPAGEVETWGNKQITVVLGHNLSLTK
jgi:cyanophycinase-like exopeptidase